MSKYIKLIILFIFASLCFYNPSQILSVPVQKMAFYSISVLCIFVAFRNYKSTNFKDFPKVAYCLLIFGFVIAALMGTVFHEQSMVVSIQAILFRWFAYSFLFILFAFNPPIEKIEKLLVVMGIIGMIVNGVNMLTAPHCLFGSEQEEIDNSRGFIRVRTTIIYIVFLFFYSLSQYKIQKKKLWGLSIIASYMFIVFWVARQYIVLAAAFGLFFYMSKVKLYKKFIIVLFFLGFYQIVISEVPFVKNMIEMSENQHERSEEKDDIRIIAWDFYTNSYQTNEVTRILGNGVPSMGNSTWGYEFQKITDALRVFPSDVGWAGFYFYHGLLALLGLAYIFIKAIFCKKVKRYQYISYPLLLYCITSFAGGGILFPEEVTALMLFFYIALKTKEKKNNYEYL